MASDRLRPDGWFALLSWPIRQSDDIAILFLASRHVLGGTEKSWPSLRTGGTILIPRWGPLPYGALYPWRGGDLALLPDPLWARQDVLEAMNEKSTERERREIGGSESDLEI